jgi:hypothetical protein
LRQPFYIGLEEARQVLAEMGVRLSPRQMKRAAEPGAGGKRKLPFFIDPIDGRLKIERQALVDVYMKCAVDAERRSGAFNRHAKGPQ